MVHRIASHPRVEIEALDKTRRKDNRKCLMSKTIIWFAVKKSYDVRQLPKPFVGHGKDLPYQFLLRLYRSAACH